jgi:hypothetical protein
MLMKPSQLGAYSTGSRFLRSVHLETDLPDADSLQGHLVTSGTRTVLPRLRLARQTSPANRAFTITGPYGTGKSAQSLFSARVLAPPEFSGAAAVQRLLHKADSEIAAAGLGTEKDVPGLLPVAVPGSRESLPAPVCPDGSPRPGAGEPACAAAGHRPSTAGGAVPASKLVWADSGRRGATIVRAGKHQGGDPASARCGSAVLAPVGRESTDGSSGVLA